MRGNRSDTPDESAESSDQPSRRAVLRRGTLAAVATTAGVGAFSGTAAASDCPRTPGYWMNHEWPSTWRNVNDRIFGVSFGSPSEGRAFLAEPARGDKAKIIADQLIASILNFQVVGGPEGDCYDVYEGVADVDGDGDLESVFEIKGYAQNWINQSAFQDPVRSWTVSTARVPDGEILKNYLDTYNNNDLLECVCDTGDDGEGGEATGRGRGRRGRGP